MTFESRLLHVAPSIAVQHAINPLGGATDGATKAQRLGLKSLAQQVLGRNTRRNSSATNPENERNNEGEFVAPQDEAASLITSACKGLSITPEQLRSELTEGGDMPDLVSGALTPQVLRLTARTLALMRYPYALPTER
jgi:hypothetical protein